MRNHIAGWRKPVFMGILAVILCGFWVAQGADKIPRKLGLSWQEQAEQLLMQKQYSEAVNMYTKWLEASPRDANAWYNLACAYSLMQLDVNKALAAFETAIAAGFSDCEHAKTDPDLENIRNHPRFQEAIQNCEKMNMADAGSVDVIRHFLEASVLETYLVALPPDYATSKKKYPICLILHGSGSTEINHGKLVDEFGREDVIYICPRALHPHSGVFKFSKKEGYTAWPPYDLKDSPEYFSVVQKEYVDWIFDCVKDVRKQYRTLRNPVFIFGHSQGASFASHCAMAKPNKVAAYYAYAGGLRDETLTVENFKPLAKNHVTVHLVHCKGDEVLPPEFSEKLAVVLKKAGVNYSFREFQGDHRISDNVVTDVRKWLDRDVRPLAK